MTNKSINEILSQLNGEQLAFYLFVGQLENI
jgi:hypothetical protein